MAFDAPPRVTLQGESERTFRWDLMRPDPKKNLTPPRRPQPVTTVPWVKDLVAELPNEVSRLATLGHSQWWNGKALQTLKQDYLNRYNCTPPCPPWVRELAAFVAGRHDVPVYLIFGKTRCRAVVHARQELTLLIRCSRSKPSYPTIAKWLARKDHTTSIHSVNSTKNRWLHAIKRRV
jgi:hypothetical protein